MDSRINETSIPLYRRLLGTLFDALPPRLRELHGGGGSRRWTGFAEVRRGKGPLAGLVAYALGLPKAGVDVPVVVVFEATNDGELWTREFGGRTFSSTQWLVQETSQTLLVERFGPVVVASAVRLESAKLFIIPRSWSLLGIPMPGSLRPNGMTFETEEDGKFRFHVEIDAPIIGLIVSYDGALTPEKQSSGQGFQG